MKHRIEPIAMGFPTAAQVCGMSKRFLENAARDLDPKRRLRTVRVNRRRLIRAEDLRSWFEAVAVREDEVITAPVNNEAQEPANR